MSMFFPLTTDLVTAAIGTRERERKQREKGRGNPLHYYPYRKYERGDGSASCEMKEDSGGQGKWNRWPGSFAQQQQKNVPNLKSTIAR
jgi:hypothetical protein